jgi:PDZ domain-containing protein
MRRRGLTVLVGAVLIVVLTVLVFHAEVPYVQLEPGPTYDTLGVDDHGKPVITVTGKDATTSRGQLRFVTIGVQPQLTLIQALIGWWNGDDAVVPRELVYPPDQTEKQVDQKNAQDFTDSESAAQTAALGVLGYVKVSVKSVIAGQPADGKLKPGDVITSVDGTPVHSAATLLHLIRSKPVGSTLAIVVTRAGAPVTTAVTTAAADDGTPRIGIETDTASTAPFTLSIPIEGIGGPSAGLMLSLGIVDKAGPVDLTGGRIIAGTGTIDALGQVGPIGGVPQKLIAAKRDHATYFLTPKDNCAEAVANAQPGLTLVQVTTLDDALDALTAIRSGSTPTLCPGAH